METRRIFLTGATGYLGSRVVPLLRARGHMVRALIRPGSASKLPSGIETVVGNPLDAGTFADQVVGTDTLVHLVGVPKPAPWKGEQFRRVDGPSALAAIAAAKDAKISHIVYVSVAHPAPIMKDYIEVREACEAALQKAGVISTILRPWYVLGPGHWWPVALRPAYWFMERWSSTRESALRLGLVTIDDMLRAMVWAVEQPPAATRIL
ncbi:MAG: NAD(P)H-binding protein [Nitrospiraceae bacterium]